MKRILILLPALLIGACAEQEDITPIYDTAGVQYRTLEVAVSSAGIVEPLSTVEVKSKASGEVLGVSVETGDQVEEGSLMVSIDPRIVRNRLAQSDAELKAAISRREIATTQKKRVESLVANGTLTQSDLEQATLDLANAEAQVVTAEVAVENARIAVDDTDIRAPIGGTIIFKPVEIGQVISSPTQDFAGGTMLLQMADLSAVQIRSLVDETDIGKIRPGMRATVSVAAYPNQPFPGEVVKIEPQAVIEQNVTMFAVLVSIQNPDGLLMPGMNAEVEVSIARAEDAMTIPVMALRTRRDLESTALILDRPVEDITAALSGGEATPQATNAERPRGGRPGGNRGERGKRGSGGNTDYRFGGEFWVVLDTPGREIRKVTTGVTDLDNVEVVSGLGDDERVLILPSSHLLETQQDLQRFINRRVGGVPGIG
ncbi:MAG: efflux RND transporter periplasmic adaptor subunit [Gammaproteobacteria bacterium]|nr:efflux RND transporter periplasmic adaptor subunit [Gammaproteobacteria bacterium]MDH3759025.1 efflux RND transporter periplasmic adaptor subunit [Gammaproteobacteria bacterium]